MWPGRQKPFIWATFGQDESRQNSGEINETKLSCMVVEIKCMNWYSWIFMVFMKIWIYWSEIWLNEQRCLSVLGSSAFKSNVRRILENFLWKCFETNPISWQNWKWTLAPFSKFLTLRGERGTIAYGSFLFSFIKNWCISSCF